MFRKIKNFQIKSISWTNVKPPFVGRQSKASVIIGQPGPFREAKQALERMKSWEFFLDNIIKTVVIHTNNRTEKVKEFFKFLSKNLFIFTCDTDEIKIRVFIELIFFCGRLGLNYRNTGVLYDPIMGPQPLGATMRQNRLEFLCSRVLFDDFRTRSQR